MRQFETENWQENKHANSNEDSEEMCNLRPLLFEVHSVVRVWHFKVQIFINKTSRMSQIVSEIVCVHIIVMNKTPSVQVLRFKVEAYIIEVGWPHLIVRWMSVMEIFWEWKWEISRLEQGHFSFKILILASIVKRIPVFDSNTRGSK